MLKTLPAAFAATLLTACSTVATQAPPVATAPVPAAEVSASPAVTAADPRAQAAGEAMLAQGGSSADAAAAIMLALTVVEPQSSGIGGGGFAVRGTADGEVETLDGRETAPAGADPRWFYDAAGELPGFEESVKSGLSVGVPGNIALIAEMHRRHGKLAWAELFAPAIALAREGFRINPRLHDYLVGDMDRAALSPGGRALFYGAGGAPLPVGTLVRNPDLAHTLERVAKQGPDAFYSGAFAESLARTVAEVTPRGGAMTAADIAGYVAKERPPVCGSYRGYRVCGMGPPSSGGVAVLQMLGQLERFDLAALGPDSPVFWHLFLESQRLAYADRELYIGDSDFVAVPVEGLVDRAYLAQRSALIAPDRSIAELAPGTPPGWTQARADGDEPAESGTSHFAVVDGEGTMISYTSTVEGPFGSGLTAGGFYLNNELTDFSRAGVVDGVPVANRVEGGKRPRSSMAPSVVYDPQGRAFLAVGAAGGSTIPVQTARAIIGVIDFGLGIEDALGLPLIMQFGDTVIVEEGTMLQAMIPQLQALGHEQVVPREPPLKAGGVLRTPAGWQAARDPRLRGKL